MTKFKSPFISSLEEKIDENNIEEINRLINEKLAKQSPITEELNKDEHIKLVTFMREASTDDEVVYLLSILTQQSMPLAMQRLDNSRFHFCTIPVTEDIRTSYGFGFNMQLPTGPLDLKNEKQLDSVMEEMQKIHSDPYNPNKIIFKANGHEFPLSILEMPFAAIKIWNEKNTSVATGSVTKHSISSEILHSVRTYWVYTPANYDDLKKYPMLMFFDGQFHYQDQLIALTIILDNLIAAEKIPPVIAVLVDSVSAKIRMKDLMCDKNFTAFILEEIMPEIRANYAISERSQDTMVAGGSLGGLFALYLALQHPEQFGMVLCNSPAYWVSKSNCDDILEKLIMENKTLKLRVYMDVGVLEAAGIGEVKMLEPVNYYHTLLRQYGHEVKCHTFAGGHDLMCHEQTIPDALMWLFANVTPSQINHAE